MIKKLRDKIWGICFRFLKRWSRSGLFEHIIASRIIEKSNLVVISVGGQGPVDQFFRKKIEKNHGKYVTFDIDENHLPEILADISNIADELLLRNIKPDVILALEVFEHVRDVQNAIDSCLTALSPGGYIIISTPWIIPIHDRPHDFRRLTPAGISELLKEFNEIQIVSRGNFYDSIVMLMLRGLFSGGAIGKFFMLIGLSLSIISRKPKIHINLEKLDSVIGYIAIAKKT